MAFEKYSSVNDNVSNNNGIVKLFAIRNLASSEWSISGSPATHFYNYFIIPSGFYFDGGFKYNFSFNYIEEQVQVYDPHDSMTEPFWHLIPATPPSVELQTDPSTRLPYLIKPSVGEPNYIAEKCYLIPLGS